jgi:hypothetical protein
VERRAIWKVQRTVAGRFGQSRTGFDTLSSLHYLNMYAARSPCPQMWRRGECARWPTGSRRSNLSTLQRSLQQTRTRRAPSTCLSAAEDRLQPHCEWMAIGRCGYQLSFDVI